MDFDMFLSSARWDILEILAKRPTSPVELASELGTSVSYVSQQLRLLEAGNLITKVRTGNAEKGKPRMLFSLPRNMVHLAVLVNSFPAKKLLYVTPHHMHTLRIWMLARTELHHPIEKLYWKLEDNLEDVEGMFVSETGQKPVVYVLTSSPKVKKLVEEYEKNAKSEITFSVLASSSFRKVVKGVVHVIYDPRGLAPHKEERA